MNGVVRKNMFSASAPLKPLQTKVGFTPKAVVGNARMRLAELAAG